MDYFDFKKMRLSEIDELMSYHDYVCTNITVKTVKNLVNRVGKGKMVFYNIYMAKEKKADSQKRNTDLIILKGKLGRKFAVVNADGE